MTELGQKATIGGLVKTFRFRVPSSRPMSALTSRPNSPPFYFRIQG